MIGQIHYGEVDYYHGIGPWYGQYRWNTTLENGGSSLLSAGCHALDALLLCMGNQVEEVSAYETQSKHEIFQKYEYKTTTVALLKFKNGSVGKVASVIDCLQPYYFHTHLVGSEGSLLDNKLYSTKLALRDKKWTELPMALADSGDVADHPTRTSSRPSSTRSTAARTCPGRASPNRSNPSASFSPATSRPARDGR